MAYEQCPKKVQKWLDEEYLFTKEQAKQENAEIYWGDETGVKTSVTTVEAIFLKVKPQ